MEKELNRLWKVIFDDTDEYIRLFFDRKYKPENCVTLNINEKIVAALHILPYDMIYLGSLLRLGYIAGVGTCPEERGKGHMTTILKQTLTKLHTEGYAVSALIPAENYLFDIYAGFGYTTVFYNEHTDHCVTISNQEDTHIVSLEKIYTYYRAKAIADDNRVLHDRADMETILSDIESIGGSIVTTGKNESITGMAFVSLSKNKSPIVSEWFYDNDDHRNKLLRKIEEKYRTGKIEVIDKVTYRQWRQPLGMIRIISPLAVLTIYAQSHPHIQCTIAITDCLIPQNTGIYEISDRMCVKTDRPVCPDYTFTIEELAQKLWNNSSMSPFEASTLYMCNMMNE